MAKPMRIQRLSFTCVCSDCGTEVTTTLPTPEAISARTRPYGGGSIGALKPDGWVDNRCVPCQAVADV